MQFYFFPKLPLKTFDLLVTEPAAALAVYSCTPIKMPFVFRSLVLSVLKANFTVKLQCLNNISYSVSYFYPLFSSMIWLFLSIQLSIFTVWNKDDFPKRCPEKKSEDSPWLSHHLCFCKQLGKDWTVPKQARWHCDSHLPQIRWVLWPDKCTSDFSFCSLKISFSTKSLTS